VTSQNPAEQPTTGDQPLAQNPELRRELQATLSARQELGTADDPELIDAFLRRLDQAIDARIDEHLVQRPPPPSVRANPAWILAIALGLAIPLVAIAGGIAGAVGIVAVLALVGLLVVYFDRRHP
jgi:Flp pilus assembly protein TadB